MHETLVEDIRAALGQHGGGLDTARVRAVVSAVHASDLAFVLDELTLPEAERVFLLLDDDRAAEALARVAPTTNRHLLQVLSPTRAVELLRRLPMDEAAEVVSEAGVDGARLLGMMSGAAASDVERLLGYADQTAGRLMTTRYAAVPAELTVARTFEYLRVVAPTVETLNTVYGVNDAGVLVGVCSIRELLIAAGHDAVGAIMRRDVISVPASADQEDVARVIGRYDLNAVPVVDEAQRLVGIVTVDDVLDVLTEEFNEDYTGLVGSDAAEMDRRTPVQIARIRLPWLLGTMAIELCAGAIIARFDALLRQLILLASFMPVISAVSGNVGLQAAAIVVRGLDTGHVRLENWAHAVRRELLAAVSIALVAGTALAAVAVVWSRHLPFGIVVGSAMMCAILVASGMGTVIPMLSRRLGFDPATTAGLSRLRSRTSLGSRCSCGWRAFSSDGLCSPPPRVICSRGPVDLAHGCKAGPGGRRWTAYSFGSTQRMHTKFPRWRYAQHAAAISGSSFVEGSDPPPRRSHRDRKPHPRRSGQLMGYLASSSDRAVGYLAAAHSVRRPPCAASNRNQMRFSVVSRRSCRMLAVGVSWFRSQISIPSRCLCAI